MTNRLLLIDDELADALNEAIETWRQVHAGDRSERADGKRMDAFNLKRRLEKKYTKAERQEIAALALALLD